ncbi:protein CDV3 homolog isoform X1 [Rousettus aegyptiacus]|uniref:CDV3-like protein n=1 Tax=Rousettus aegyptiacus TaxID=9407 RepID=A0A7J8HNB7_ROUAE|nr:protein CDV3 homolog isoform X1 [Rousettus aegyptiacus]KAF6473550.1 CDV3-like protein [Rousettus aegyptiacus]
MAETEERSLDNFFAKRDKKKKKERSNRAASAAGAAGGAGGSSGAAGATGGGAGAGARPGDGGTSGAGAAGPGVATKAVTKDEDEWKEFEQKEVDYSGLRVQAMQISEKEEDDNEKREDPGDNWEEGGGGGGGSGVEKSSGPWNKTAPAQAPPAPVIVTETPEPAMTGGVYRPPGARLTTTRKTPQGPPEIYSDTQFPSLQSTAKHVESRKDKEMEKSFEVVRHKTRGRDEVSKNQALKLQLDNQYAVLENQKSSHTQYN